jgi:hypothetical protein
MADTLFPRTIAGFTEYIKIAYAKAQNSLSIYGINQEKFAPIIPLYNRYVEKEAIAANPETATTGARHARDETRRMLERAWRSFINESIRYNSSVPTEDLEIFGVKKRDTTLTKVGIPDAVPSLSVKQIGVRRYELAVFDSATGKKKKPKYAAGSYIYRAVTEPGKPPEHDSEYYRMNFSSNCHHILEFPIEQLAKQANICACYSNSHGEEGPKCSTEAFIIG